VEAQLTMAPLPHPVLVADIGGTNSRFALVPSPGAAPRPLSRLPTGSYPTPEAALSHVLDGLPERPRAAVLAVAGPLDGRGAQLTNAGWHFDGAALATALRLEQGLLVNDFEALAASLAVLDESGLDTLIAGDPEMRGVRLAIGPGTGFGAAALAPHPGGYTIVPTEAGHIGLGPEDQAEDRLWPALRAGVPRVTIESLLSGDGLVRLHRAVARPAELDEPRISAADVTAMAADGNPAALMAVVCFWRLLARVAGDLALAFKATGGVYIAGGIVPRLLPLADLDTVATVFRDKPPMQDLVRRIPLHVVTASDAAERGLAAIAADPVRFGLADPLRLWH
jgi:glucokinase